MFRYLLDRYSGGIGMGGMRGSTYKTDIDLKGIINKVNRVLLPILTS